MNNAAGPDAPPDKNAPALGMTAKPDKTSTGAQGEPPALSLRGVVRKFGALTVLDGADLEIFPGEIVALVGPSGSGKSSLLHIAGLMEAPTAGQVIIGGRDGVGLPDAERTRIRRDELGFVYQFHHLLPEFDALGNVALPMLIAGAGKGAAFAEAARLLALMGLAERGDHQPAQLSGGEQQRVAIARGLANHPKILLADEPTGNLDPATADKVFEALMQITRTEHAGALIATHNFDLARRMDRMLKIEDRRVVAMND